jgi:hypothetical protein
MFGLGGGFLMISPKLRQDLTNGIGSVSHQMELYAPYSYVLGVLLVLTVLAVSLYRGAQPS